MASRDNQGLQIALILFVLSNIAVGVTAYIYYRAAGDATKKAKAADDSADKSRQAMTKAIDRVNALKYMIEGGDASFLEHVEGDAEIDPLRARYAQILADAGDGLVEKSLFGVPAHYLSLSAARSKTATERSQFADRMVAEKTAGVSQAEQARQQAIAQQTAFKTELDQERDKFNQERAKFVNVETKLSGALESKQNEYTTLQTNKATSDENYQKEIDRIARLQQGLRDRLSNIQGDAVFRIPDGRVTWINQGGEIAWINVGMADGLRRQTTFSVYNYDVNGIDRSVIKGQLEVTQVLDQHLAEVRILRDELTDPILPGDFIFSPAWRPGRRLAFALAGKMDVNGDGKTDRDMIRNLITMNGGVIHAEVHDDGRREGVLNADTRYVVRGLPPNEGESPAQAIQEYATLITEADEQGIEYINVDELLSLMGYQGEARTVHLGKAAREEDFRSESGPLGRPKSTGQTSGAFRKRGAPKRGGNGAY